MGKEKSEKSTISKVDFPVGDWRLYIRDESLYVGLLNFVQISEPRAQYQCAINFDNNPLFNNIANMPFSVEIIMFDPETGVISFRIPAAAEEYNSDTSPPYQFVFIGYCDPNKMHGIARVPKDFGLAPGSLGEDGDDVTWISKGITDPPHKHSR
jgi:hypothetical protein